MLSEDQIRAQLSEWILDEFEITDCGELEMMSGPDGQLVAPRDEYLRRYRARLASLRTVKRTESDLMSGHAKVVSILESLDPGEPLTYWEARSETHEYAGVSSRLGIVSFYGPLPRSTPSSDESSMA